LPVKAVARSSRPEIWVGGFCDFAPSALKSKCAVSRPSSLQSFDEKLEKMSRSAAA
jgi:hypothetical protein